MNMADQGRGTLTVKSNEMERRKKMEEREQGTKFKRCRRSGSREDYLSRFASLSR